MNRQNSHHAPPSVKSALHRRYVLSGLLMVCLTLWFVLAPDLYHRAVAQTQKAVTVRSVTVKPSSRDLDIGQVLQLLYKQADNSIYTEIPLEKSDTEIARRAIELTHAVLGEETDQPLSRVLCDRLRHFRKSAIHVYRCLTLCEGEVISLDIVSAWFDDVYLCYESRSGAVMELSLYNSADLWEEGMWEDYLWEYDEKQWDQSAECGILYYDRHKMTPGQYICAINGYQEWGRFFGTGLYGINYRDDNLLGLPSPHDGDFASTFELSEMVQDR